jgi:hypothetical protein
MKAPRIVLFGLLLAIAAAPAAAQALSGTYTVGPGGSYANIGAAGTALIANGVAGPVTFLVTANDVGPWSLPAFPGQGVSNPVTFVGGGGVYGAGGVTISSATSPILTLSGCSHVTFEGFVATATTGSIVTIAAGTSNCTIRNCNLTMPVGTATGPTVFAFNGGSFCTVEGCDFGGGYEAFNYATACTDFTIQKCRMLAGGWWTARIGGANFTFRNNFVYGNVNYGVSCGISGSATAAVNLKLHHNSFYNTHASSTQYCMLRWYSSAYSEVLNNAFHDVHPNATNGNVIWCSGVLRPTVADYNVYYQVNGLSFAAASGNVTFAGWQALGFDANSVFADPLFANVAASPPDLHLTAASPCVLFCPLIPTVLDDIDGAPRIAPADAGAHELSANNLLTVQTGGGGLGDLYLGVTDISPTAVEGWMLISLDTTHAAGTGPMLGLWPDALTWSLIFPPTTPTVGNPLHFLLPAGGAYPDVPFTAPPGALSFLGGTSWDIVVMMLGFGPSYVGRSNVVRVNW